MLKEDLAQARKTAASAAPQKNASNEVRPLPPSSSSVDSPQALLNELSSLRQELDAKDKEQAAMKAKVVLLILLFLLHIHAFM